MDLLGFGVSVLGSCGFAGVQGFISRFLWVRQPLREYPVPLFLSLGFFTKTE